MLNRSHLSYTGLWCGEATLKAFGITVRGRKQTCWGLVKVNLQKHGYTLTQVNPSNAEGLSDVASQPTVARFIADHPTGEYILFTTDHIMALQTGVLTDTETDAGGRRRVREAHRVRIR